MWEAKHTLAVTVLVLVQLGRNTSLVLRSMAQLPKCLARQVRYPGGYFRRQALVIVVLLAASMTGGAQEGVPGSEEA
jgi:hypothetical protein